MKPLALGLALVALALGGPAAAHEYRLGELSVGHPWSRPAGKGMTGAGFLSVTNAGSTPDVLLAVETPAAKRVEIHQGSTAGGIMRMRKLKGLTIPAGGKVTLQPGGSHLMMLKLTRSFAAGDKVPATLVFERAGRVEVSFAVQAAQPEPKHGH